MSDFITKLSDMIDPEVMGDMVSARIPKKLRVAPFAKIDDTLAGVPGDTINVPAYTYIGDAADVAEGGEVAIEKMTTSTRKATIKKAMKGIGLTDEAVLSGYGNPVGEANTQLALAIAAKIDSDCMDALQTASLVYDGSKENISYNAIVDAVDLFEEEMGCSDKVLFIHPKQVTQLRKNPDFLSADKYTPGVSLTGEIGMIAGCRLVPSKKVPLTGGVYACPIVKLEADPEVDDEIPALTIYRKREVNIETERKPKTRTPKSRLMNSTSLCSPTRPRWCWQSSRRKGAGACRITPITPRNTWARISLRLSSHGLPAVRRKNWPGCRTSTPWPRARASSRTRPTPWRCAASRMRCMSSRRRTRPGAWRRSAWAA